MFKRLVPALPALVIAFGVLPAGAATLQRVTGQFEVEHGATNAVTGGVSGKLDPVAGTLKYRIRYSGLSGPVNAIHLHGPADAGTDAGVLVPVPSPYGEHMRGTLHLTPEEVKDVEDGKTYINLHTEAHANGEARAQLMLK